MGINEDFMEDKPLLNEEIDQIRKKAKKKGFKFVRSFDGVDTIFLQAVSKDGAEMSLPLKIDILRAASIDPNATYNDLINLIKSDGDVMVHMGSMIMNNPGNIAAAEQFLGKTIVNDIIELAKKAMDIQQNQIGFA